VDRTDGGAQHGVAATNELDDAALERRALEQHVTAARPAPEPDVGAEPVDQPGVAPAGVTAPEADKVAQVQLDDGMA
jgi:hypothetical protein